MRRYHWRTVTVFCDVLSLYPSIATMYTIACRGFQSSFQEKSGEFDLYYESFDSFADPNYEGMLRRAKSQSRIILIATNGDVMRKIMVLAYQMNMTGPTYVFLYQQPIQVPQAKRLYWEFNDSYDAIALKAYQAIIMIELPVPDWDPLGTFVQAVARRAKSFYNYTYSPDEYTNDVALAAYESVLAAFQVISESWLGLPSIGGKRFSNKFANRSFALGFRTVNIGANGLRYRDTWFRKMDPYTKDFEMAWYYTWNNDSISEVSSLARDWRGGSPPSDMPHCGFTGDRCTLEQSDLTAIIAGCVIGMLVVAAGVFAFVYLRFTQQREQYSTWWYLDPVHFTSSDVAQRKEKNNLIKPVKNGKTPDIVLNVIEADMSPTSVMMYKDERVWVQVAIGTAPVTQLGLSTNKKLLKTLAEIRSLHVEHIGKFFGVLLLDKQVVLLWKFGRGSLRSLLDENKMTLDQHMKMSLGHEMLKGLAYIHTSKLRAHGSLCSLTTLLDSRFAVILSGHGSRKIDAALSSALSQNFNDEIMRLWGAPEQTDGSFPDGTKSADIYAFAVVFCEVWTGGTPHNMILSEFNILDLPPPQFTPFNLQSTEFPMVIRSVLSACLSMDPAKRPDAERTREWLKRLDKGGSVLDGILASLDKYSAELEEKIAARSGELVIEMAKVDVLLKEMIPGIFVSKLRNKEDVPMEQFEAVTIYFSSLVGFDAFCLSSSSAAVVELLNDVYRIFDHIVNLHDVYKVETIKDSYMVASGLPMRNDDRHAAEIAEVALDVLEWTRTKNLFSGQRQSLEVRIGIHTGPCAAGIVGTRMPRYCLFGDTINTASRMESHGQAKMIHISSETETILRHTNLYVCESRGLTDIKGKGQLLTYWLTGHINL